MLNTDPDGGLVSVWSLGIAEDRVQSVRSVVNPAKLAHLGPVTGLSGRLERAQRSGRLGARTVLVDVAAPGARERPTRARVVSRSSFETSIPLRRARGDRRAMGAAVGEGDRPLARPREAGDREIREMVVARLERSEGSVNPELSGLLGMMF